MYYLLIYDGYVSLNNCSIDTFVFRCQIEMHPSLFFLFGNPYKKFNQFIRYLDIFDSGMFNNRAVKLSMENLIAAKLKNMSYLQIRFSIDDFGLSFEPGLKNNGEEKRFAHFFQFL